MTSQVNQPRRLRTLFAALAALGLASQVGAQVVNAADKPADQPAEAATKAEGKDVVVDAAPAPPASAAANAVGGRLVRTPGATGTSSDVKPPAAAAAAQAPAIFTTALHDGATAAVLADFGLALMQQQSRVSGNATANAMYSPLSAATALGVLHAGAGGETARELAALLGASSGGDRAFSARLPSVLERLGQPAAGATGGPFVMANRVWVQQSVAGSLQAPFKAMAQERFNADAASISFDDPTAALRTINQWTATQTRNRIPLLLPEGSLSPTTRVVVTNAIHFKSPWARLFDPKSTEMKPFQVSRSESRRVPTMVDERPVLQGMVDNISVIELPFAGKAYSLLIGMPPKGHSLDALEKDLAGLDMASWSSQLTEGTCRLELPKFTIDAKAVSLKSALQALGVRTMFTPEADLQPLLGKSAASLSVDDVFHSATIVIDESGGEAAAATGASVSVKSFSMPAPVCAVDRAFIFALVHKPTGTPLFVGKVADPSRSQ